MSILPILDQRVLATLPSPWSLAILPGGNMLVSERAPGGETAANPVQGNIRLVTPDGVVSQPLLGTPANVGVLDIELDTHFSQNHVVYFSFIQSDPAAPRIGRNAADLSVNPAGIAVAKAVLDLANPAGPSLASASVIWQQTKVVSNPGSGEPGGRITFSPDGQYLFIAAGDRQEFEPVQSLANTVGKIIRIRPDGTIPPDNPFVGVAGAKPEIWTLGHRNPYGLVFDSAGVLWENEMGPKGGDELNVVRPGANFGWPNVTYGNNYDDSPLPKPKPGDGYDPAALQWTPVIAPSGMISYSGTAIPSWTNDLIISGLQSQGLVIVDTDGTTATEVGRLNLGARTRDVVQGPDGSIWVLFDQPDGRLVQLKASSGAVTTSGALGSRFIGNASSNIIQGDVTNDTLTGGLGADRLTGGGGIDVFRDSLAGLNGDLITDLAIGEKIIFTDASLPDFKVSLSGRTLTYNGGSLTINAIPGSKLFASADPEGGVAVSVVTRAILDHDFNGDGRSDILWRHDDGRVSNWLGQGNGGFARNDGNALNLVTTNWQIGGNGDFNGDGRGDILWRNNDGQLSDWLGRPDGGFTTNDAIALTPVATSWRIAGTGDFNGDGRSDILWRNSDGQLSDWLGRADGGFIRNDENAMTRVATSWHVVGTGDFNGDGRDDILWRSDDGKVSDWLGRADGGFTTNDANALASVVTSWRVVGTGDFNGDGREDILWRSDDGKISDWLGRADGGFTRNDENALYPVKLDWQVAGVGDYNGDGRADILWRNTDSGSLSDWLGTVRGGFVNNDANAMNPLVGQVWKTMPIETFV